MNDWVMGVLIGALAIMIVANIIPFMACMIWEMIQMVYDYLKYH